MLGTSDTTSSPLLRAHYLSCVLLPLFFPSVPFPVATTLFLLTFWDNLYVLDMRVHADPNVQYVRVAWID